MSKLAAAHSTLPNLGAKTTMGAAVMRTPIRDRIVNALLILLFFSAIAGSAYYIFKRMVHWNVEGLG